MDENTEFWGKLAADTMRYEYDRTEGTQVTVWAKEIKALLDYVKALEERK